MLRFTTGPKGPSIIILVILVANSVVSLATVNVASYVKRPRFKVCESVACQQSASFMLNNMDKSVNPCDDFYQFACGSFVKNAVIADHESTNVIFSKIRDEVQEQLRTSIENGITETDPRSFKLLQSYYKTCMNEEQIEKTSEKEFLEILEKLGGWPVLVGDSWDESKFNWVELMHKFRETGYLFDQFIGFGISTDMKDNSKKLIYLDQATLGLPQEYLSQGLKHEVIKAYYKYMVDFAVLFGVNREQAEKDLGESLNFEIDLAKISLPSSERRDSTKLYNPMTVLDLQANYPVIPSWLNYLNAIFSPNVHIKSSEVVIVQNPEFLLSLANLLAKTPKRVVANYAFWRVAAQSASQLSERVDAVKRKFVAVMSGASSAKKDRWKLCVNHANSYFHLAAGALYVRRHVNKATKKTVLEMTEDLRESFQNMIKKVDWMDDKTKEAALDKLNKITPLVGYPDELLDDEKIDAYYKPLTIYPESYLKSVLSFNIFANERAFEKFREPVSKVDWTGLYGNTAMVNAFYDPTKNTIQFPSGILQGAFFNAENPKYMNYAAIGSVMGHEMTHGFDDQGSQFDKEGNLVDWWDPKTKKEYLKRAQCIIDQYSNFTEKEVGLKLNGKLTQGENIADNGGIKEAYFAYEAWIKKNGVEPRLPGLESFSPKQTFWLANANVWCAKYRPQYLENLILTDPHTPHEFRVNGPVSNMPKFAEDFNCPVGSKMNPVDRCTVW